jgi:tetratricopeptide (TPR) repeat protein
MILFATIVLIAWLPIVMLIFAALPARRAVVICNIVAWLFLPSMQLTLPGVPDYSKVTATTMGVLLGSMIFDPGRLFSFRFRWYDLPIVVWCLCPLITSMTNDLGLYDGLSNLLQTVVLWGLPYWIGRTYLADADGLREFGLGIVIGGLAYVPLCLYEVRFSPVLNLKIYGFMAGSQGWEGLRYGGYRPRVFLTHGLECGMWFTMAMMVAVRCWTRGVVRSLGGWPFWMVVAILGVNTVLCKATGAMILLLAGLVILWLVQKTKSTWPVWVLILLPPVYAAVRTTGLWSGRQVTELTAKYLGEERAYSIETRFYNEVILIEKALQRPIFGWGGYGRSRVFDESGKDIVLTDGYWVITFGSNGIVGVASLLGIFAAPLLVLLKRQPVATWADREMVPVAALAVILGLYSVDNLSNATPNPLNPLMAGGLCGLPAIASGRRRSPLGRGLEAGDLLAADGRLREAATVYRDCIVAAPALALDHDSYRDLATTHSRLASIQDAAGLPVEAEAARREAIAIREALAEGRDAEPRDLREFATALEDLAHALAGRGHDAEVAALRRRAVETRAGLAPYSREDRDRWLVALNDLAWLLATSIDATTRDAHGAVAMAERATTEAGEVGSYWNTLGVARYYAGDERGAVEALERSISLGPPGGTAFDLLILAMARHRLGEVTVAREAYARGVAWADRHQPGHPGLARFRIEARDLIGGASDQRALADRR